MQKVIDNFPERAPDAIPEDMLDRKFIMVDIYHGRDCHVGIQTPSIRDAINRADPTVWLTLKAVAESYRDFWVDHLDDDQVGYIFTNQTEATKTAEEWSESDDPRFRAASILMTPHIEKLPTLADYGEDEPINVELLAAQDRGSWKIVRPVGENPPSDFGTELLEMGVDPVKATLHASATVSPGSALHISILSTDRPAYPWSPKDDRMAKAFFLHESTSGTTIELGSADGLALTKWLLKDGVDEKSSTIFVGDWQDVRRVLDKLFRTVLLSRHAPAKRRLRAKRTETLELVEIG